MIFDKYFYKRDEFLKRRISIDISLYEELKEFSKYYDASINRLLNVAIEEMLLKKEIHLYDRKEGEKSESHNFNIREQAYRKLEKISIKQNLSITKLINIAVYEALNS